jgi:hypothetical protein
LLAISPRVLPRSMPSLHDAAQPAETRQSRQRFFGQTCAPGQRACQSRATSSLISSAPTSVPSGFLNSISVAFVSFATLLLLAQSVVCCIDRLNPPSEAAVTVLRGPVAGLGRQGAFGFLWSGHHGRAWLAARDCNVRPYALLLATALSTISDGSGTGQNR